MLKQEGILDNIFHRLHGYFESISEGLSAKAKAASVFPNKSDIGNNRESAYEDFLRGHIPGSCSVMKGGFIFGQDGSESKQIDLIVINNSAIRFNLPENDSRKSFSFIEGAIGAISVKSMLDKDQLIDSLENINSIPDIVPLKGRVNPMIVIGDEYCPIIKMVYAHDGLSADTILEHLDEFYKSKNIPHSRKPVIIHVLNKYMIIRCDGIDMSQKDLSTGKIISLEIGKFYKFEGRINIQAMMYVLARLQEYSSLYNNVSYDHLYLLNKINDCA